MINKMTLSCLLAFGCMHAALPEAEKSRILYMLQAGDDKHALDLYEARYQKSGRHDAELLQEIALLLIEQGYKSSSPEGQLLALYGAGIATNEKILNILQDAVTSTVPQFQLIALNFLAKYHNDFADESLNQAMKSDFLIIRLEAALHLAEKKHPKAVGQIEALMYKVDPEIMPIFPQILALNGTNDAIKILKKLLNHSNEQVRVAAITSIAQSGRDDLLPQLRTLASQHSPSQQEAAAFALGKLKDDSSIPKLESMAKSKVPNVRLAALQALYQLGRKEAIEEVKEIAFAGDPFAIQALGAMEGAQNTLLKLAQSSNLQIKTNAAIALLELNDPRSLNYLADVIFHDARDLVFVEVNSSGGALHAWKAVPSARQNFSDNPIPHELSLHLREEVLAKTAELPEGSFLSLAEAVFEAQQNELVPLLVNLLENLQTPDAIKLLKKYQQKAGAPLIRNYCNLALYRLKEEGPYKENLKQWVKQQQTTDLIQFRPMVPWDKRLSNSSHQLTPQDTSRLLIDAFETLALAQDEEGINMLLDAIRFGNAINKFTLAGLLMHATQ